MELTLEQQKQRNKESISLDEYALGISSVVQTYRFGGGGDLESINAQISKYNELVDMYSEKWQIDESDRKLQLIDKPYEISQPIEYQQEIKEVEQEQKTTQDIVANVVEQPESNDNRLTNEHDLRSELNKYKMAYHESNQISKDSVKLLQKAEIDRDHMSEALMQACKIIAKDHTEKNAKQWYLYFTSLSFEEYIKSNKEKENTLKKVKQNETKEEA